MCICLSGTPGWKTWQTTKVNITPVHITPRFDRIVYTRKKIALELPHAIWPGTLKVCVGTLNNG